MGPFGGPFWAPFWEGPRGCGSLWAPGDHNVPIYGPKVPGTVHMGLGVPKGPKRGSPNGTLQGPWAPKWGPKGPQKGSFWDPQKGVSDCGSLLGTFCRIQCDSWGILCQRWILFGPPSAPWVSGLPETLPRVQMGPPDETFWVHLCRVQLRQ